MHPAVEESGVSVKVGSTGFVFGWGRTDDNDMAPAHQLKGVDVKTIPCKPIRFIESVDEAANGVWKPSGAPKFICSKPSAHTWLTWLQGMDTALCGGDSGGTKPCNSGQ